MGKTWLELSCVDQAIRLTGTPRIASGGVKEDYLRVTFCDKWDGYAKTAIFFRSREEVYGMVLDSAGECEIPHEVLATPGVLHFAVYGTKDGATRTSEIVDYTIQDGAITSGLKNSTPATQTILEQITELVASKAPVASPTFTGTPTAPTAPAGTSTTQLATTAFVAAALAALVDSAPETLDTLEELAAALGNDPNFATTITTLIGKKAAASDLTAHKNNTTVHITAAEREAWNAKQQKILIGSTDPGAMTGLVEGDIYIYCPTMGE